VYINQGIMAGVAWTLPEMPSGLRDHYTTEREAALDLTKALGLTAKPSAPILRRM